MSILFLIHINPSFFKFHRNSVSKCALLILSSIFDVSMNFETEMISTKITTLAIDKKKIVLQRYFNKPIVMKQLQVN